MTSDHRPRAEQRARVRLRRSRRTTSTSAASWRGAASTSRRWWRARGVPRRRPVVGRRHRRHALRALPRPGRAADVFEKLDDCATVHALVRVTPGVSLHIPWDKPRATPASSASIRAHARAVDRLDELEHVPGSAGPAALVQVRQPDAHRRGGARAGGRAQPRVPRDRPGARRHVAHGLDRRRRQLSRARCTSAARSSATSTACARSTRRCPTAGGCSSSTSSTSRRSTRPSSTTGARATARATELGDRACRSSISGITRRTSTSR